MSSLLQIVGRWIGQKLNCENRTDEARGSGVVHSLESLGYNRAAFLEHFRQLNKPELRVFEVDYRRIK